MVRVRMRVRFKVRVRVRPFSCSREVRFWTRPPILVVSHPPKNDHLLISTVHVVHPYESVT